VHRGAPLRLSRQAPGPSGPRPLASISISSCFGRPTPGLVGSLHVHSSCLAPKPAFTWYCHCALRPGAEQAARWSLVCALHMGEQARETSRAKEERSGMPWGGPVRATTAHGGELELGIGRARACHMGALSLRAKRVADRKSRVRVASPPCSFAAV
jgi:hypothetical protein